MRVAMGLALNEVEREARAIEFYNVLSSFDFMSSTPTLFNSGTHRSQLSSCYLTTVADDLEGIYDAIKENALLSKFAGGLGNDWTPVRALGSHIKGTNGKSQGVVPFLKVVNDTAVAVNQGGKRKGAVCSYLETWHLDIEEFLELRKNTGDDRRRTHDMNTANWVPDLFMKRVMENGEWTLFSPSDVPDLHDKFGKAFETAYVDYERKAASRRAEAVQEGSRRAAVAQDADDAVRDRASVDHVQGSVQYPLAPAARRAWCTAPTYARRSRSIPASSEIAVCNLGSVNLAAHIKDGKLDRDKLKATIATAMRMLDNVIDINYYAVDKARNSNFKHRPVGLGIMGFQDCLHMMRVPYASKEAVEFADRSMEAVAYYAYWASTELAEERGPYSTFEGSLWHRGILPAGHAWRCCATSAAATSRSTPRRPWTGARCGPASRSSACATPTASPSRRRRPSPTSSACRPASSRPTRTCTSNPTCRASSRWPTSTWSQDLKKLNLWDEVMVADLKYFDGTLAKIDRIPPEVRSLYATAFEIDPSWLVEAGARRQKWIDQAQSLNIYMAGASGKKLDETYKLAWLRGLKTTYYLRTLGATHAEKSTVKAGALNAVPSDGGLSAARCTSRRGGDRSAKFCVIDRAAELRSSCASQAIVQLRCTCACDS